MTIICDLDGTLCNSSHRQHFMRQKPKDWESFYAAAGNDPANVEVLRFLDASVPIRNILLVSGRPDKYRDLTTAWLEKFKVPWHGLFMRKTGDYRSDYIVKKEIFENEIYPRCEKGTSFLCIDDRNQVVDMWRSLGLQCWQVADGNF